jgi:pSer/pThr/pTyr-binding forkhead associated (FHA) protein
MVGSHPSDDHRRALIQRDVIPTRGRRSKIQSTIHNQIADNVNCAYNLAHSPVKFGDNPMNPRIVVMAGPLKGKTISLTEEETSIGRNVGNLIQIDTELVSRSHCLIKRQADEFVLRDLNSRNSTFVNEVPINERVLKHGDQIIIGESQLVFLLHEDEAETPGWLQFEEGDPVSSSTVELRADDSVYLQPERVQEALPKSAKIARNLSALLKISSAINSIQDLKALEQRVTTVATTI